MTIAELKRRMAIGTVVTMTGHDWYPSGRLIGIPRTVVHVDTVKVGFAGDDGRTSYMSWPRAGHLQATGPDTFAVALDDDGTAWMHYRIESDR